MCVDAIVVVSPANSFGGTRPSVFVHGIVSKQCDVKDGECRARIACGESV